jgi:CubicO group peptidase (beta-lactamase class C family)
VRPPVDGGYGYQWWLPAGRPGVFQATGIFGQTIYIDRAKHVVIIETSAWPQPDPDARWDEMDKVMQAITAKFSAE